MGPLCAKRNNRPSLELHGTATHGVALRALDRLWPTLAKQTLANFSVSVFWPNFLNPISPNPPKKNQRPTFRPEPKPQRPKHQNPGRGEPTLRDPTLPRLFWVHPSFLAVSVLLWLRLLWLLVWTPLDSPPPDRPKFRSFFPLPSQFSFLLPLSGSSRGILTFTFGVLWLSALKRPLDGELEEAPTSAALTDSIVLALPPTWSSRPRRVPPTSRHNVARLTNSQHSLI